MRETGEAAEAEGLFRAATGALDAANPAQRAMFIAAQVGLGQALTDEGRATEALPLLERALEMSRERFGEHRRAQPRLALKAGAALNQVRARSPARLRGA